MTNKKYNGIKVIIPYEICMEKILPSLKKKFTFEEFFEQFLLEFNPLKKDIINDIGLLRVKLWLRRYYLPKVAKRCKEYSETITKVPKWTAAPNYNEFKITLKQKLQ